MKYNKLVRDKIPEIIESNNEKAITRVLSDEGYRLELEKKLYEEYEEVINSNGDERIEELADMLEVMIALANNEGKDFEDIEKVRVLKKEKRGGFSKRIYLEDVR